VKIDTEVASGPDTTRPVAADRVGLAAVFLIAVAATLGVLPWLGASMFADEGATVYSAHLSWTNLWAQSQHVDLVLLPYYVLMHYWQMISGNIAWVRSLSLLAFFGTILATGWMGLRIAGRWCGIIASVLTATSTLLVEKALNARPYELSSFLVVLCALSLFKWLEDSRARRIWTFCVLAVLATAMQLFSLLAPASMLVCVLLVRPGLVAQRLRALRAPLVFLAIVSVAWVIACMREVGQGNWIGNESSASRLAAEIRGPIVGQLYDFVFVAILVLAIAKLAVVWTGGEREAVVARIRGDRDVLALTIGWVVVPTLVLSIVSFVHPIFSVRYVAASAPGAALLAAFVCVRAFPTIFHRSAGSDRLAQGRPRIRTVATVGVAAAVLLAVGYVSSASALQEDLQSPAQYIAQHRQEGDVVALPDHALTSAISYYLERDGRPVPLWPQVGVRQRYVEGFDLLLNPSGGLPPRVWLVSDGSVPGVTRFERRLESDGYVLSYYKVFLGSSLLMYRSSQPTTAVLIPSTGATLRGPAAPLIASASAYWYLIAKVQFVLSGGEFDNTVVGGSTETAGGWVLSWNTTAVPNGTYRLQSVATNAVGVRSDSAAITITVDN
jgi:mannosyltransferase